VAWVWQRDGVKKDMLQQEYDVIVVGAGPAGSSAAQTAAQGGASVLLLEQNNSIGLPVQCAGGIPAILGKVVKLTPGMIARQIKAMKLYLPDGQIRNILVSQGFMGYVLNRELFDKELAYTAWSAGAKLSVATKVIEITPGGVIVQKDGDRFEIKAKVIIGADGPFSVVGKYLRQENTHYLRTMQCQVLWDKADDAMKYYFHSAYEGGYAWVFPKGNTANLGVGCLHEPAKAMEHFLAFLNVGQDRIVGRGGGMLPVGGALPVTVQGNCMLVGDAAGQVHPITGEGIRSAVVCGKVAGKFAAEAALSGDLHKLTGYSERWQNLYLQTFTTATAGRRYMEKNWTTDVDKLTQIILRTWGVATS